MFENLPRITVFSGGFGSGKTEITLNFALALYGRGKKVKIVDLDIINPYFRTRVVRERLSSLGVEVISPEGKLAGADVPALNPAVWSVLQEHSEEHGVFDAGGGDIGAIILGRFKKYLLPGGYNLFLVVNTCRPYTRDPAGIISMLQSIEKAAGVKVTGLVSNPNLGAETGVETIRNGHRVIVETAARLGLPVVFLGVREELAGDIGFVDVPVLPLKLFMRMPWHDNHDQKADGLH
ncbi:MAG: hypothetical protein C4589_02680 [Peptococcaceae bacterium]|nr:MAG: hypothetical protein C4589_02680 [Peptococcaceae bacterium]